MVEGYNLQLFRDWSGTGAGYFRNDGLKTHLNLGEVSGFNQRMISAALYGYVDYANTDDAWKI